MEAANAWFESTLVLADSDPNILAFWLDGSRGKGRSTAQSDYDCTLLVRDEVQVEYRRRFARQGSGVDCLVQTLDEFAAYSAWDGSLAWNRYNYVHIQPLVDKTHGRASALIRDKARIPPGEVSGFVERRLDHYVNQVYRAAKCRRDGMNLAARIEAAASVEPLLDVLFALDGGRLRPYPKYLQWELETHPLHTWADGGSALSAALSKILEGDPAAELAVFDEVHVLARARGLGPLLKSWGDAIDWLLRLGS